jgi:hypothetical protein
MHDCTISKVFFLQKDVRDGTIRNGQSIDTDIEIHKEKTLDM